VWLQEPPSKFPFGSAYHLPIAYDTQWREIRSKTPILCCVFRRLLVRAAHSTHAPRGARRADHTVRCYRNVLRYSRRLVCVRLRERACRTRLAKQSAAVRPSSLPTVDPPRSTAEALAGGHRLSIRATALLAWRSCTAHQHHHSRTRMAARRMRSRDCRPGAWRVHSFGWPMQRPPIL